MRKSILTAAFYMIAITAMAQADSTDFKCKIYNQEYDIYLDINFYDKNVQVPGQELFGEMPGYFGDKKDSRKWLITDVKINGKKAQLDIINDYGSEDLTAELSVNKDGTYSLTQQKGSNLKIARNKKWVKLPKKLSFIRQ